MSVKLHAEYGSILLIKTKTLGKSLQRLQAVGKMQQLDDGRGTPRKKECFILDKARLVSFLLIQGSQRK